MKMSKKMMLNTSQSQKPGRQRKAHNQLWKDG